MYTKIDAKMYNALDDKRWMYTKIGAQMYNALDDEWWMHNNSDAHKKR